MVTERNTVPFSVMLKAYNSKLFKCLLECCYFVVDWSFHKPARFHIRFDFWKAFKSLCES